MLQLKRILPAFIFFFGLFKTLAQPSPITYLTSQDGLSTVLVRDVIESRHGNMWIATQDGLNYYNGSRFKLFRREADKEASLPASDVNVLLELNSNQLIAGTRNGLAAINQITHAVKRYKIGSESKQPIAALDKVNDSTALVATGNQLFETRFPSGQSTLLYNGYASKIVSVKQIGSTILISYEDGKALVRRNMVWTTIAMVQYKLIITMYDPIFPGITCIRQSGNRVFAGTNHSGILELDTTFRPVKWWPLPEEVVLVRDIEYFDNHLLLATSGGLVKLNLENQQLDVIKQGPIPYSLNSEVCNAVCRDRMGNIWIGTEVGGINLMSARATRFKLNAGQSASYSRPVFAFSETKEGHLLIAGSNLFWQVNPYSDKVIQDLTGYAGNAAIISLASEDKEWCWLGSWGLGAKRVNVKTGQVEEITSRDNGGTVLCLKIFNNKVYIGTLGDGLFEYDLITKTIKNYNQGNGLHAPSVSCIFIDKSGKWWLGSLENGIAQLKGLPVENKIESSLVINSSHPKSPLASDEVRAIQQDQKGNVWVATAEGLSVIHTDGYSKSYNEKDGLPSASVYALLPDDTQTFWCSTNAGLFCFHPDSLGTNQLRVYNSKDGLLNDEFNMGAAFKTSKGLMAFGGAKGFNFFDPVVAKRKFLPPQPILVAYRRSGKDVETDTVISHKQKLEVSWRENYFQLELGALEFADNASVRFRYKLEGYDRFWSDASKIRHVSYTALPGGTYTFMVQAQNNDGIWADLGTNLVINVVPPFWKTIPFYIFMAILLISSIWAYTHYRNRVILKENKLLELKVAERTKELAEKNHDIMSSIQYAKRIQEAILPAKDNIYEKLNRTFILYKPKDIVSGDFYWFAEKNQWRIFATVDCTGHGVPGAFMSMIGHNLLHQIVLDKGYTDPGEILTQLHRGVQKALRQGQNEVHTNDGMDVSLLAIHTTTHQVTWAGANRPLVLVNAEGALSRLEGNKFPVGGVQAEINREFNTHQVVTEGRVMTYMFSDGYADQFGGEKGKKFMVKRLHETLCKIHNLPANDQRDWLDKEFEAWRGELEQVDDVLVVGIEI